MVVQLPRAATSVGGYELPGSTPAAITRSSQDMSRRKNVTNMKVQSTQSTRTGLGVGVKAETLDTTEMIVPAWGLLGDMKRPSEAPPRRIHIGIIFHPDLSIGFTLLYVNDYVLFSLSSQYSQVTILAIALLRRITWRRDALFTKCKTRSLPRSHLHTHGISLIR